MRRVLEEDMIWSCRWRIVKRATSKQVNEDFNKIQRKGRRLKKEGLKNEV